MRIPLIEMPILEYVSQIKLNPIDHIEVKLMNDISFAVKVLDNGLSSLNVEQDDILLFKKTTRTTDSEQIIFGCLENEDFYIRILEQFDPYGTVRLRGGRGVPVFKTHLDSIAVKGISSHVYKPNKDKIFYIDTWDGKLTEVTGNILSFTE